MAQERPLTPEKQLLNLIESPKAKARSAVETHAIRHQGMSLLSPGAWMGRVSFFRGRFRSLFAGVAAKQLDIRVTNGLLLLCIFIMAGYFAVSLVFSLVSLKKIPELNLKVQEITRGASFQDASLLRSESYYLDLMRQRNIFKIGQRVDSAPQEGPKATTPIIIEATKNLQLVGISWSDTPDAMIEDTKSLRTFFVKTGQMVGELRVQAIFKDKVVLSYGGEEIELK